VDCATTILANSHRNDFGRSMRQWPGILTVLLFFMTSIVHAGGAVPSVPGVDSPELAALGQEAVGFRTITLAHKAQPDFMAVDAKTDQVPLYDRPLTVDIWYPAIRRKGAKPVSYRAAFWGEPPKAPVAFAVPGLAIKNAKPKGSAHPLVIVSHGYSNAPAAMTWLTENLASKGYVVAAIHHDDPNPYMVSADKRAAPNFYRPHDIAFVTSFLRETLGEQIDPKKVALIGYSQGGYGVLTAGGASLDPAGPSMDQVSGGWLKRHARGAPAAGAIIVPGVKAIVALAPAGGFPKSAWGAQGLAEINAPLLLIQGDADPVVDYKSGALAVFDGAVKADRFLLTYKQAGHAIALNPAPPEMRGSLWDIDWFEDPIWRNDRLNAINMHFITAFLAMHLRGEVDKRAYLDVPVVESDKGEWNAPAGTPWGAYSPGGSGVTLWKGFQRRHAMGMELRHAVAGK
jgi:predicted dienelactone hydrolase